MRPLPRKKTGNVSTSDVWHSGPAADMMMNPANRPMPGECYVLVGQNPRAASSTGQTQHTQLATGTPTGQIPAEQERKYNYEIVKGGRYAKAADAYAA